MFIAPPPLGRCSGRIAGWRVQDALFHGSWFVDEVNERSTYATRGWQRAASARTSRRARGIIRRRRDRNLVLFGPTDRRTLVIVDG
jgi:hypothetical protein